MAYTTLTGHHVLAAFSDPPAIGGESIGQEGFNEDASKSSPLHPPRVGSR
jgi:hypothetical protein